MGMMQLCSVYRKMVQCTHPTLLPLPGGPRHLTHPAPRGGSASGWRCPSSPPPHPQCCAAPSSAYWAPAGGEGQRASVQSSCQARHAQSSVHQVAAVFVGNSNVHQVAAVLAGHSDRMPHTSGTYPAAGHARCRRLRVRQLGGLRGVDLSGRLCWRSRGRLHASAGSDKGVGACWHGASDPAGCLAAVNGGGGTG